MFKNCGGDNMLCNRIKQFREYNDLEPFFLAEVLGISLEKYNNYESGKEVPTIDVVHALARCYKVTVDEFYGYTPRLAIYDKSVDFSDDVDNKLLRMSDLSWEEAQLILYYRNLDEKDDIIKKIIGKNNEK
jgi:transcriptional regulator with XRE-family HTH domain